MIYAFLSPFDLLKVLQLSKAAGDTLTRQQLNNVSTWTAIFKMRSGSTRYLPMAFALC